METEEYIHHDRLVTVISALKGKHRDICLCYSCDHFHPEDRGNNCPIANRVFATCVDFGIVTPVTECPRYEPRGTSLKERFED